MAQNSEYLYRVLYNGNKIFEGDEDNAKLMFKLMNNSKLTEEVVQLQRAQLVWWNVPPENFQPGTT